jgi:hypothetical protein
MIKVRKAALFGDHARPRTPSWLHKADREEPQQRRECGGYSKLTNVKSITPFGSNRM